MRNCKQMTQLISEAQDRTISKTEALEMRFHTMICSGCRAYKHNIYKLKQITQEHNKVDKQKSVISSMPSEPNKDNTFD